jgi:hypothetical protein
MSTVNKSFPLFVIFFTLLTGCSQKTTNNKTTTSTTSTNASGTNSSSTTTTNNGCDGIARDGITTCYYTNLPTLTFSGPGTVGPVYWSSNSNLPGHISPNQFRTDATFNVRIKPLYADGTSLQGRTCSQFTKTNFSKLQVQLMLRRSVDSLGEVKTLTADVNSNSAKASFTVPGGTTNPYILEVISVMSNHRCNAVYGSAPGGCPNAYYDIPKNTNVANPTECVAFKIEYSTDNTLDLPN